VSRRRRRLAEGGVTDKELFRLINTIMVDTENPLTAGEIARRIRKSTGVTVSPQFIGNFMSQGGGVKWGLRVYAVVGDVRGANVYGLRPGYVGCRENAS